MTTKIFVLLCMEVPEKLSPPNLLDRRKNAQGILFSHSNRAKRKKNTKKLEILKKVASAGDDLNEIVFCARFARAGGKATVGADFSKILNKRRV